MQDFLDRQPPRIDGHPVGEPIVSSGEAVHCLERGIDIHLLQEILGHRYLQTTAIYNEIAQIELVNVRSPFEDLEM